MKITNKLGLPQAIVNAVKNDPYDKGDCDISVTTLIAPPQIRQLKAIHENKIEEDVIDRIWALLGQAVHTILERSGEVSSDTIEEWRLAATYRALLKDFKVSGQADMIDIDNKAIWDFKVTSTWSVIHGPKPEWNAQLNVLADIFRKNGGEVKDLFICAILRDWQKSRAMSKDYPKYQLAVVKIPLWTPDVATQYIHQRLTSHYGRILPDCTSEERWHKDECWAVMKDGRKSAVKLYYNSQEAEAHVTEANDKKLRVEHRPGTFLRCQDYCSVSKFCPQYKETLKLIDEKEPF